MSEKSRKSFTSQIKAKVALEAIRGIKTLNEIAQEFSVHPTQVGQWKKELLAQASGIFDTKRGPKCHYTWTSSTYAAVGIGGHHLKCLR